MRKHYVKLGLKKPIVVRASRRKGKLHCSIKFNYSYSLSFNISKISFWHRHLQQTRHLSFRYNTKINFVENDNFAFCITVYLKEMRYCLRISFQGNIALLYKDCVLIMSVVSCYGHFMTLLFILLIPIITGRCALENQRWKFNFQWLLSLVPAVLSSDITEKLAVSTFEKNCVVTSLYNQVWYFTDQISKMNVAFISVTNFGAHFFYISNLVAKAPRFSLGKKIKSLA